MKKKFEIKVKNNMQGEVIHSETYEGWSEYKAVIMVIDELTKDHKMGIKVGITDIHHGVDYVKGDEKTWMEIEIDNGKFSVMVQSYAPADYVRLNRVPIGHHTLKPGLGKHQWDEYRESIKISPEEHVKLTTEYNDNKEPDPWPGLLATSSVDDEEDELTENLMLKQTRALFNDKQFTKYPILETYVTSIVRALTTLHGFTNRLSDRGFADYTWNVSRTEDCGCVLIRTGMRLKGDGHRSICVRIKMDGSNIVYVEIGEDMHPTIYRIALNFKTRAYLLETDFTNDENTDDEIVTKIIKDRYGSLIDKCVDVISPRYIGFRKLK